MRIDLLFPRLPPALDGIGDYTAQLAYHLAAQEHAVRILTAASNAAPIARVDIVRCFSMEHRHDVLSAQNAVCEAPPDWLVVQYNPFAWGTYGLNLFLPLLLWNVKRTCPEVHIAVMFHEDFVPVEHWRFAVMTTYQRLQFFALGALADGVFFSIGPWAKQYASWFKGTPVAHLPVGSNIPRSTATTVESRARWGLADAGPVVGVFGTLHETRLLSHIQPAVACVRKAYSAAHVLYVGPHGEVLREALPGVPIVDAGRCPAPDVAHALRAMDVHLAPFKDGASTRRGSMIAGLNNGVPTVSTLGPLTDDVLVRYQGAGYKLAPVEHIDAFAALARDVVAHPAEQRRLSERAVAFHDALFDWCFIARRMSHKLSHWSTLSPTPHAYGH